MSDQKKQEKIDRVILELSSKLVNISPKQLDNTINSAIKKIGKLTEADRVYIFEIRNDKMYNTYEWCLDPKIAQIENLQGIPSSMMPWWMKVLGEGGNIELPTLDKIPKSEKALRKLLEDQDIKSLLVVPVYYRNKLRGFLGLDYVKSYYEWNEQTIRLLRIFATIIMNTVQRIKYQIRLKESQELLNLSIQGSNIGIWDWNIKTGETTFNDNWARMIGYTLDELMPTTIKTWEKYCHPDDLKRSEEALKKHFQGKSQFYEVELRMKHKNGTYIWVLDRGRVLEWDKKKKPLRMSGTHIDISERKRIQEQNEEIIKLHEVSRLRDLFLSMTSHELRTPITPMKAELEMLLEEFFGKLNIKQKQSLELILKNTNALDNLIADIVDISRIESGVLKILPEKNNLNTIIKEAVETMRPKADLKNINIRFNKDNFYKISVDAQRIRQVIINLLNNAIKFTGTKGKILVTSKNLKDSIKISVKDTGIGIKESDIKRIFDPFVQADNRLTRKYEGSGLGLAISKGIIEAHRGKITVKSKQKIGSTFTIFLPKKRLRKAEAIEIFK